jgi:hypothetical protein
MGVYAMPAAEAASLVTGLTFGQIPLGLFCVIFPFLLTGDSVKSPGAYATSSDEQTEEATQNIKDKAQSATPQQPEDTEGDREKAKDRSEKEQEEANQKKHSDPKWEEPESEDFAKWKAKE